MVSDLGWEPLQKRRQFDRLTTLYKIQLGLVETDTGDIVRPNDKRTRGQQQLYQPTATAAAIRTPSSRGPSENGTCYQSTSLMLPLWRNSESV